MLTARTSVATCLRWSPMIGPKLPAPPMPSTGMGSLRLENSLLARTLGAKRHAFRHGRDSVTFRSTLYNQRVLSSDREEVTVVPQRSELASVWSAAQSCLIS